MLLDFFGPSELLGKNRTQGDFTGGWAEIGSPRGTDQGPAASSAVIVRPFNKAGQ